MAKRGAVNGKEPEKPSAKAPVELIPQPHGGALASRGYTGNRGNTTPPPPSTLRGTARMAWAERIPVLTQIADGDASERTHVLLADVLQYAECPNCSAAQLKAAAGVDAYEVRIDARTSPRAADRVKAMAELSRVGMSSGITADDVRQRLNAMMAMLELELDAPTWTRVFPQIRACWRG